MIDWIVVPKNNSSNKGRGDRKDCPSNWKRSRSWEREGSSLRTMHEIVVVNLQSSISCQENLYETFILLAQNGAFLRQTKTDCSYALVLESASIQSGSSWQAPNCHEQWMIFETDVFVTQIMYVCWRCLHLSWYACTLFTSVFYSRSWFYFVVVSCHTVCVGILYGSILFSLQLNFKLRMLCMFAKF